MAKSPLEVILDFCDLSNEHIEHMRKTLYKYKDDPVVNLVCTILNENATQITRMNELFHEANIAAITHAYPLVIPSPNSPTELRVYPNIILDDHSSLESVCSTYCQSHLKTFLAEYDTDIQDENKKQRWLPQERAEKRLLEFIDLPTARALSRYVFADGKLKDHQIRDFAEAIDLNRKPLELTFCEKPSDYVTMYGSGPHSCMAESAVERGSWDFMKDEGIVPTSWYYWNEYTSGVYTVKKGKVSARTVLFKKPEDKNWSWVRIYADNDEVRRKFIQSLAEHGINQCTKAEIPAGYNFTVPGIKKGSVWAAPWPYIDAPIPSHHSTGRSWYVKYDKNTHEFTFYYNNPKYDMVQPRGGHVISSDYSSIECTSCGKSIKKNEVLNVRVDSEYHTFCSDTCAVAEGFIKVVEGNGNMVFKVDDGSFIDSFENNFVKFSTLQAAKDNGYYPVIDEAGVLPEETDFRVTGMGRNVNNDRLTYRLLKTGMEHGDTFNFDKIPFKINSPKKVVEFDENKLYVEA